MRPAVVLLAVAALLLAGCALPVPEPSEVYHQPGIQCESRPWDGDEYGGTDEERIARLRAHYEAQGVQFIRAVIVHHDVAVPAVCDHWDGTHFEIEVEGDFPQADADGWRAGPADYEPGQDEPAEGTFHQPGIQCQSMPWDGDEYGGGDEARIARLRAHYEAQGVDLVRAVIVHYGVAVYAVCDHWDGTHFEIEVEGDFPQADPDGWQAGPAPAEDRID